MKKYAISLRLTLLTALLLMLMVSVATGQVQSQTEFSCSSVTEIPLSECEALVAFYNSTSGPLWQRNTAWLQSPDVCNWEGVDCNSGSVQSLELSNNILSGSIPPQLGNLANLAELSLGYNQLSGSIPPQLGNLANLATLYLHGNQLSGSIPPQLGNLANLRHINLYYNQLSGSIPPELGNLANLQDIDLALNQLSGSIPPQLGNLANLRHIYFGDNQLSGSIPPELGNLANLVTLDLGRNQLSGSIPPQLGNLLSLRYFHFENNQLSGSIPPQLGNLANLQSIGLVNNQLSGSIPPELGNLTNLQGIRIDRNQLSGSIPPELGNLTNLRYLYLNNNQLSGSIPLNFIDLPLAYFWFDQTGLCEPADTAFRTWLGKITHLRNTGVLCADNSYSISGKVTDATGKCNAGVMISATPNDKTMSGNDGNYVLTGLPEGTYTLTPSKSGCTFVSPSLRVAVPPDAIEQDFVGAVLSQGYSISGHVTDDINNPIAGVTISDGAGHNVTTDTTGDYTFSGLVAGTYPLTPSKSGYTFSPDSYLVSVPSEDITYNFSGFDKPPIVFVHGWAGIGSLSCDWPKPDEYFETVDNDLDLAGYYVAYAKLETSPCHTPHLVDNVPRLKAAIDISKGATNQPKVILVAHSMGGLVSRAYIEGADYQDDVSALFTFGSPHLGAPDDVLAYLANGLSLGTYCGIYQPAVCDFSVTQMFIFNLFHKRREGVEYHAISGQAPFLSRNALGMVMDAIISGPDDGIVQTVNGIGLDGVVDRALTDEVHIPHFGSRTYFIRDGGQSNSYTSCLKTVLVDGNPICGSTIVQTAEVQDTPELSARTPFEYGQLLTGQIASRSISAEGGATLFATQWQTGTLAVTLVDPTGQLIDPIFAANNPDIVSYSADATVTTYYLSDASAGMWQLVLQATTVPIEGSDYITFAAFDSPIVLTAGTDKAWYAPAGTATITATLTGSLSSGVVTGTILRPDGVTDTITLLSLGTGEYRGTYSVPDALGYTEIRLFANGMTVRGAPFERGRNLLFQILPTMGGTDKTYLPGINR